MAKQQVMSNGDVIDLRDVKVFKLPKIERYFQDYDKAIKSERLAKANLNKIAETRLKYGRDFLVTNPIAVDNKGKKTEDGIFSPKFGFTQFDDPSGSGDAYRCQCGDLTGAIYLGEICESCGTEVIFMDADVTIMGWIPLMDYVVINPSMYIHLQRLIGKDELNEVLRVNSSKMTVDGIIELNTSGKNPYHNVGMMYFYEHFDEILDYYLDLHPEHKDQYDFIKENRDCVFTRYIPVYSAIMRPRIESNEKVRLFEANKIYDTIMNQYQMVIEESSNMLTILPALYEIQTEYNDLFSLIVDSYSGKEGMFRSNFGGIRIDFGGRAIIVPGIDLMPDEIDIPYLSAIVFLELELIYLLCILDDITENEAYQVINDALRTYNPRIQSLAQTICDKSKVPIHALVNRQPTLSDRSIRLMRVRKVGTDIDDLSMRLPPAVLDGMKGDHDGDSLSIIPLKDWRLINTFKWALSPRYNYISRTNGRYSDRMGFIKDYIIILSELYSLSKEGSEKEVE